MIPLAATASGGETIAPNTNASGHVKPGIRKYAAAATANVVKKTKVIARADIGLIEVLNSCHEVREAASYNKGGRIRRKTTSGFRARSGNTGTKPMISPAAINMIGYGNFLLSTIAISEMMMAIINTITLKFSMRQTTEKD